MKDFFEDLGRRLGETAETVTNKAGDAIEIQRLRSQIRGLARGNAVDLVELGRTIYDRYKAGEEVEENVRGLCDAIRDREESIGEYEKKISRIKGASECPKCGKMVAKDMSFCPYCGEKMEFPEDINEAEEDAEDKADQEDAEESVKEAAEEAPAEETDTEKAE
ncbi:MAG TPA: zinc ribbon domain-containing protein [Candidatus Mediterraneibacter colneyensis]|nr:zinc ribbon domain-containing protein [Candidatus Mediterraneibacter colneyensis]